MPYYSNHTSWRKASLSVQKYHPNTIWLIALEEQAIRLGWYKYKGRFCFCEQVAKLAGEEGNEYPSDKAIKIAEQMVEKLKILAGKSKKWRVS